MQHCCKHQCSGENLHNDVDQQSLPCSSCEVVEADLVLLDLEALIAPHRLEEDELAILVFRKRCEGLDEAFRPV